jgi:hypothetical protein
MEKAVHFLILKKSVELSSLVSKYTFIEYNDEQWYWDDTEHIHAFITIPHNKFEELKNDKLVKKLELVHQKVIIQSP